MPELPEVETIRRGLTTLITDKTVQGVQNYASPKSFPNAEEDVRQFLLGAKVVAVKRRAKVLLIELSTNHTLVIHLKMTGQIVVQGKEARWGAGHPSDSLVLTLPDRSTRQRIEFSDGTQLFFNDQRKFGWIKLYPTPEVAEIDFMKKVGPEPLEDSFTTAEFAARLRRRSGTTIKAAILDQTVLAGVGNIYADESLWGARIHPATRVAEVTDAQISKLLKEIRYVMNLAIAKGGSTDRNYVNAEGKKGSYLDFARVFRRQGQTCPRCGTTIVKTRVAGRGTHLCPHCQTKN